MDVVTILLRSAKSVCHSHTKYTLKNRPGSNSPGQIFAKGFLSFLALEGG